MQDHEPSSGEDELNRAMGVGSVTRNRLSRSRRYSAIRAEAKQRQVRKLVILTGVCLLIPPLWPVALGLTLYLLYPETMARLGLAAAIALSVSALLLAGLLGFVMVWLVQLLF